MHIYHLVRSQLLPITQDVAWAFFANPANLQELTPDWMQLTDDSPESFKTIFTGMIQILGIQLPGGFPCQWVSGITHVEAPHYYVEEQKAGPFSFWHHRHQIIPTEDGVEIRDTIDYALAFGLLGHWVHNLFIRAQLHELFDYRAKVLEEFFGSYQSRT